MVHRHVVEKILELKGIDDPVGAIQEKFFEKMVYDTDFRNGFLQLYDAGQIGSPFDDDFDEAVEYVIDEADELIDCAIDFVCSIFN